MLETTYEHVAAELVGDGVEAGFALVDDTKFRSKVMRSILEYAMPAGNA